MPLLKFTWQIEKKLKSIQDLKNRFNNDFNRSSFSILSQRSLNNEKNLQLCNGIRVDFAYILTSDECCENVQLLKGMNSTIFYLGTKDPRDGTVSSRTFLTPVLRREDTNLDFCKETAQRRLIQKIFLEILVKKVENV